MWQRTGALAVASLLVVAIQECAALRSGEHTGVVRRSHEILNLKSSYNSNPLWSRVVLLLLKHFLFT